MHCWSCQKLNLFEGFIKSPHFFSIWGFTLLNVEPIVSSTSCITSLTSRAYLSESKVWSNHISSIKPWKQAELNLVLARPVDEILRDSPLFTHRVNAKITALTPTFRVLFFWNFLKVKINAKR